MATQNQAAEIGENIWLFEGPLVDFYGFPYPTRMLVVRLPNGTLWIWSPIALTPELKAEVEALGAPAHLVSPNKLHHLFLGDWQAAYPVAKLWGPASTLRKRKDLRFEPALTDDPPAEWQGAIAQFWMQGSFLFEEVLFFHKASRTAIIADLSEHFSEQFLNANWRGWKARLGRLWGIVEGVGHAPLELRLSWFRRKGARQKMRELIALRPERVVMAHGEWIRDDGAAFLKRAFDWLLGD